MARTALWLLAFFLAACPSQAQRGGVSPVPVQFVEAKTWSVPAELDRWMPMIGKESSEEGAIVIAMRLNGRLISAMVDSGAPYLMIDRSWASQQQLPVQANGVVEGLNGGVHQMGISPLQTFELGGIHQSGGAIGVADLSAMIGASNVEFQAVIGGDVLTQWAEEIDFDNRRMRLRPSGTPPPRGIRIPIHIVPKGLRMQAGIRVDTATLERVLIDGGDTADLSITRDAWSKMARGTFRVTDLASATLGSSIYVTEYLRADNVRLGGVRFDRLPTRIEERGLDPGDEARIGLGLLRRFNLFIDARKGFMILSARSRPPSPQQPSTSGVQWMPSDKGLLVVHVMRGSPAALAGLRDGDHICELNGEKAGAGWLATPKSAWGRGLSGTAVALALCDGRRLSFVLKEFY